MDKKIVIVVAEKDFRDEEYFIPKSVFKKSGFDVVTVGSKKGVAIGLFGGEVVVENLPEEVDLKKMSAVVFVGGPGAVKYLDNEKFYKIIRSTEKEELALGAICISPLILANAGVLEDKEATVWSSDMDKTGVKAVKEGGAIYKEKSVVVDERLITANGPDVASDFANKVLEVIDKKVKKGI